MRSNTRLRIHVINVGHGDAILVELPDEQGQQGRRPRFGLVDAGGSRAGSRSKTVNYLRTFLDYRLDGDPPDYAFEFVCLTHPHQDHYSGMKPVLDYFLDDPNIPASCRPRMFWDCGFRYNTAQYLQLLGILDQHREVRFVRLASGTEFHYDDVRILVLAPSIDLRNRYDTYGIDLNDASIVLRISRDRAVAILAADAHFDSWGKICEEFPRKRHMAYPTRQSHGNTVPDVRDPNHPDLVFLSQEDQLNCSFLKVAHHGSKRGTSYEYIEKLSPSHFAITSDNDVNYRASWKRKFPHPITRRIIGEEAGITTAQGNGIPSVQQLNSVVGASNRDGTLIYTFGATRVTNRARLRDAWNQNVTTQELANAL